MTDKTMPAANLIAHRSVRCLLAALFAGGFASAFALLFEVVTAGNAAYLFFLVLATAFTGAQIHERMLRQAG